MSTGTVKFFNETKGFGFIKDEETNQEFFVHVTGLAEKVTENDQVTFDVEEGKKGLMAVNVKKA
jgi:CspA family cold shock protein